MRQLSSEPLEVVQTYQRLVSLEKSERLRAYGKLPSSMKAAMWSHQLLTALAEHHEFTEEQRAVLYDALDLFKAELFEITYPNPAWSTRVDQPIHKIEQRARAAFGAALAAQLFARLGPEKPTGTHQIECTIPSRPHG